jgi:signal transduction histidine kinase
MSGAPNSSRFALYIFIFLVVFCLAQLTWWIIYQYDINIRLNQHRIHLLDSKINVLCEKVNHHFQRIAEKADYLLQVSMENRGNLERQMDNLLSDEVFIGYIILGDDDSDYTVRGTIDSTFYYTIDSDLILFFDPEYPSRLIEGDPPNLIFTPLGHNGGDQMQWVHNERYVISPEALERIEIKLHKSLKMFVFEGSFFMLIVLFGAYLIYRTLQRAEDLKTRQVNFIQSVTHEFRTPLTSLRLFIETLQSGQIDTPKKQVLYDKMLGDCDRLDSMVDNVLEAGHLGRKKYELELSSTDLSKDLNDYINDLKPYIERQDGYVTTDLQAGIRIRSDYHALGRAIRALIDNALKYSPPERRHITVKLESGDKEAVITILDRGFGIPNREQKKIFERFYRIESSGSGSVKGTGLGLYLVRHIVQAHGGTIGVESKGQDQGTRFIIRLPLVIP